MERFATAFLSSRLFEMALLSENGSQKIYGMPVAGVLGVLFRAIMASDSRYIFLIREAERASGTGEG